MNMQKNGVVKAKTMWVLCFSWLVLLSFIIWPKGGICRFNNTATKTKPWETPHIMEVQFHAAGYNDKTDPTFYM